MSKNNIITAGIAIVLFTVGFFTGGVFVINQPKKVEKLTKLQKYELQDSIKLELDFISANNNVKYLDTETDLFSSLYLVDEDATELLWGKNIKHLTKLCYYKYKIENE